MGRMSRDKGARGERELAAKLDAHKISRSGYTGPDLIWQGRFVEVKRYAQPISKKIDDLLRDCPIVIERADRGPWVLHAELDTVLDMLEEAGPNHCWSCGERQ